MIASSQNQFPMIT